MVFCLPLLANAVLLSLWTIESMQYRPEIDGIRALAVVPVILFHAGFAWFAGGFVGVDVFFVISGYLITTIIQREISEQRFSLIEFYERRARRILPALMLVVLMVTPVAYWSISVNQFKDYSQSLVAVATFSSNILFWVESGYFNLDSELKPLLHTWSLAIEEQYYVLFPLILMLLRRASAQQRLIALGALLILSLLWSEWRVRTAPDAAFFLLPSRFWELLVGAMVALSAPHVTLSPTLANRLSVLGLTLIVASMVSYNAETAFPGFAALPPVVGTALMIACVRPDTWVQRLLSARVLVAVGLVSYSAYLWHQPLFALARLRSEAPLQVLDYLGLIALTGVLSWLSWRWVEAPFRDRQRVQRRAIFKLSALACGSVAVIGCVGHFSNGFEQRLDLPVKRELIQIPRFSNGWCFYSVDSNSDLVIGDAGRQCWLGSQQPHAKGLLFGDSFAGQYEPFWDALGKEARVGIHAVTTNWCYPALNGHYTGPDGSPAWEQCQQNRRWLKDHIADYDFLVLGGDWGGVLEAGWLNEVTNVITAAREVSVPVIIMPSPPLYDESPYDLYEKAILSGQSFDINMIATEQDRNARAANARLRGIAAKQGAVFFITRADLFRTGAEYGLTTSGLPFSFDGRHISIYGAQAAYQVFQRSSAEGALIRFLEHAQP